MIHHNTIIALILLITATCSANAQTYNWAITHSETGFVDDSDTVKSTRRVITRMNISIEPESQHRLRVTINELNIDIPDVPSGPLHYNSAEPDTDDPEAEPNPLARFFEPLANLTFTLTYDPDAQIITASEEITELTNLGLLGQAISPPYLTIPFAPYMMAAALPEEDTDNAPENPLQFKLIPDVGGFNTTPIDLDYDLEQTGSNISTALKLNATNEPAKLDNFTMDAMINVAARSESVINSTRQVKVHTYTITQGIRTTEQATRKFHNEFTTSATMVSVSQDAPAPKDTPETE